MFIYVEWKIDLTEENKIKIFRISADKMPNVKYEVSKKKFVLSDILLENNLNLDKIYFTRVKVGTDRQTDALNLMMYEGIEPKTNIPVITIYICSNNCTITSNIKHIFYNKIFTDENNHLAYNHGDYETNSNDMIKMLKKNNVGNYTDKWNNPFSLRLNKIKIDV